MTQFHLHLISDSTGDTLHSVARATVSMFDDVEPVEHFWNMVRHPRQLALALEEVEAHPGPVLFTLLDESLRRALTERCRALRVPCIGILDPVFHALAQHLNRQVIQQPGRQHALDSDYFHRIEAMDFSLAHDDGQSPGGLGEADVIIIGASRTSKTPTCIYLANRGLKAANIPFVPGVPMPPELDLVTHPLVVGLINDAETLVQIRRNRLRHLNRAEDTTYTDPEAVREEVRAARRFFTQRGWPVINVARRSIEETSAEIIRLITRRNRERSGA